MHRKVILFYSVKQLVGRDDLKPLIPEVAIRALSSLIKEPCA